MACSVHKKLLLTRPGMTKMLKVLIAFYFIVHQSGWAKQSERGLNIALHAQSRYVNHGWVAGSEITTAGMLAALQIHPKVNQVKIFAPFAYDGLFSVTWDILLVEGWTGSLSSVIRKLRSSHHSFSSRLFVLHWCLDTYPDLSTLLKLDVDGFATNSRVLSPRLSRIAPTLFLPLAADLNVMAPMSAKAEYMHPIVYLGQASTTKHRLLEVLSEVAPLGLAIYGLGWDRLDDDQFRSLTQYWHGVLPKDDIAQLYSSATVVIGTTEEEQRHLGCVNNRVFEALACGAVLVSDKFESIYELFQDTLFYHEAPGDALRAASYFLHNDTARIEASVKGRALVAARHTYDHRVGQLVPWLEEQLQNKPLRTNRPSILFLYESATDSDLELNLCVLPALLSLSDHYQLRVQHVTDIEDNILSSLDLYSLILIRANWDSQLRKLTSDISLRHPHFIRQQAESRGEQWRSRAAIGLLLSHSSVRIPIEQLGLFDLIWYESSFSREFGHVNQLQTMCVDVDAMRENSEGWNDPMHVSWDQAVLIEAHLSIEEFVSVNGALCGHSAEKNVMFVHSSITSKHTNWPAPYQFSCNIEVVDWSRPEAVPSLLRSAKNIVILPPVAGGVLFLAALAVGSQVTVIPESHELSSVLQNEVFKVSQLHQPPLHSWALGGDFPSMMLASLDQAVAGTRSLADVTIIEPREGAVTPAADCQHAMDISGGAILRVMVAIDSFRLPDDGKWCILVDSVEHACVGDVRYDLEVPMPHCDRGKDVELQAVLKDVFEPSKVLRVSKRVLIKII